MISSIMKSLGKARSATAEGLDALNGLREAIAERRQQIAALHRAPLPVAAALARFDSWCDSQATAAMDALDLARLIDPQAEVGLRLPSGMIPGQAATNATPALNALFALLAMTCRDQLRRTIAAQLGDLVQGRQTLTDQERAALIAEAEKALRSAMAMEELAVRQLEASGIAVARRADADPAIVLATDATLAKAAG